MQLFHEEHTVQNTNLTISNPDIVDQCRKVLRLKTGELINVQSTKANITTRHLARITGLAQVLTAEIIETTSQDQTHSITEMLIAMPNKRDKLELIVQKLSELGIQKITFRPAERSVIKQRNPNKEKRILSIIKEAVEQSRGWFLPKLSFEEFPENSIDQDASLIIFDKKEHPTQTNSTSKNKIGIIGPEGGLTQKDYERFAKHSPQVMDLGSTILRMETAAIVGGRLLKNK